MAAAVSAAWDAGIRLYDVAPFYGHGLAEQRLGEALGSRLDQATISTKVGIRIASDDRTRSAHLRTRWKANAPGYSVPAYDEEGIRACFYESTARIGREHIDFVLLHGLTTFPCEAERHLTEARRALETLRDAGLAGYVGAAVNSIEAAERVLDGWKPDVLLIAGALSLAGTEPAAGFLERCQKLGISIIAAAPFAGGTIFKDSVTGLMALCGEYDVSLAAAAVQYAIRSTAVDHVVAAMSRPERVASMLEAASQPIPDEFWAKLDAAGIGNLLR